MTADPRSFVRGHAVYWDGLAWRYQDGLPAPSYGGEERPCNHCGEVAELGGPDPCLGWLPGVVSACCGHGGTGFTKEGA